MKSSRLCLFLCLFLHVGCAKDETTLPVVTTGDSMVYEESISVLCNGFVEKDGGASVYSRGICYVKGAGVPTIADMTVSGGSGKGSFSCSFNLAEKGEYSYRAYATNSVGTAYGETRTFIINDGNNPTPPNPSLPEGCVSVTFGNYSFIDYHPFLWGPDDYFDSWFHLIASESNWGTRYSICIGNCSVGTYTGYAVSGTGSYYSEYDSWHFSTEYNIDGYIIIETNIYSDDSEPIWHAKSFTINITQYDKVARLGSMTMEAVMYNCNNAYTPEGGNVGLDAAETRVLRVEANQVPFVVENDKIVFTSVREKMLFERNLMIINSYSEL